MEVNAVLADSVVVAEGKLYVQGGGWNVLNALSMPTQHDRIGIGIVVHVPYTATNQMHNLEVTLVDEDENSVPLGTAPPGVVVDSPDGKVRKLGAQFNVGRPATIHAGDEQVTAFAININGLVLETPGMYSFVIGVDGTEVSRLRFRVNPLQPQLGPLNG